MNKSKKMNPYIVCCGASGRAVIYGYVEGEPEQGKPCRVHDAKMVIYWSADTGGLLGLAAKGPAEGCKITAQVDETVTSPVTEWVAVKPAAAKAIDRWKAA